MLHGALAHCKALRTLGVVWSARHRAVDTHKGEVDARLFVTACAEWLDGPTSRSQISPPLPPPPLPLRLCLSQCRPVHRDLARMICNLEPLVTLLQPLLNGIAADLRAVAIEISQQQDRYVSDLQAALDSGTTPSSPGSKRAAFVLPPSHCSTGTRTRARRAATCEPQPAAAVAVIPLACQVCDGLAVGIPTAHAVTSYPGAELARDQVHPGDAVRIVGGRARLATVAADTAQDGPAAGVFWIGRICDPGCATTSMTADRAVIGVLGQNLTLAQCPPELRPFMAELAAIGRAAREMQEDDDETAMKYAARGKVIPPMRMDRVRLMLEDGVGYEQGQRENEEG
ncbi:hypothetical protein B0H11DRAFT_2345538 [Mycena galericulata]|nr:hypothetical protein B0H11DRAFT_2345538 [Mycena galericulata]